MGVEFREESSSAKAEAQETCQKVVRRSEQTG